MARFFRESGGRTEERSLSAARLSALLNMLTNQATAHGEGAVLPFARFHDLGHSAAWGGGDPEGARQLAPLLNRIRQQLVGESDSEHRVKQVFVLIDRDGNGSLSVSEFERALHE